MGSRLRLSSAVKLDFDHCTHFDCGEYWLWPGKLVDRTFQIAVPTTKPYTSKLFEFYSGVANSYLAKAPNLNCILYFGVQSAIKWVESDTWRTDRCTWIGSDRKLFPSAALNLYNCCKVCTGWARVHSILTHTVYMGIQFYSYDAM